MSMPRQRALLYLAAFLSALPALSFDLQSTTIPGRTVPALTNGEIVINRADQRLIFKNVDGMLGYGLLLNGVPAKREAVEGSDASALNVTARGGIARIISDAWSDEINLKNLAPGVCSGSSVADTAALKAAIVQATLSTTGVTIRAPACEYRFTVSGPINDPAGIIGFKLPSNTTLRGDGSRTVFRWNDEDAYHLFGSTGTAGAFAVNITFRDFMVRGTADTRGMANAYPFLPKYVDGLRFEGVTSEYSRVMGIAARSSINVTAERNTVRFAKRDGINLAECSGTAIRNNDLMHIDDDAISVSSSSADPEKIRTGDIVSGNRIADAQGIRALGARKLIVASNQATRIRQHFVDLSTLPANGAAIQEGMGAAIAITVTGNSFTDLIDRAYVDNLNQGANGVLINGVSARPGTYTAIPGEPDTATGRARNPDFEVFANSTTSGLPTPGGYGFVISGNIFAQTLPPSDGTDPRFTKFSDYGFGKIWTRTGWVDPALPAAAFQGSSLNISGGMIRDVMFRGNVVRGYGYGVYLGPGTRYDNVVVAANLFSNISQSGVEINTPGRLQVSVDNNVFDLDPYVHHNNRGLNGKWRVASFPFALHQTKGSGVFVRGNVIRNVGSVFNGLLGVSGWYWAENIGEADLQNTGFDPNNKGIGYFPENTPKLRYARTSSDPISVDFGAILAMPSYP